MNDAIERDEPADPRTPPPGCRLLGDYEPAQAGDMAYIGAIAGRWRKVRPRMGIIGATMDELSDGARVLALARPCRCGPDGCTDRVSALPHTCLGAKRRGASTKRESTASIAENGE